MPLSPRSPQVLPSFSKRNPSPDMSFKNVSSKRNSVSDFFKGTNSEEKNETPRTPRAHSSNRIKVHKNSLNNLEGLENCNFYKCMTALNSSKPFILNEKFRVHKERRNSENCKYFQDLDAKGFYEFAKFLESKQNHCDNVVLTEMKKEHHFSTC